MNRARLDIAIAALVIAVVGMLIVPLPRVAIDLLLVFNIATAVTLLMASLLTARPRAFQSFPTLLVITTLLRVGLEVSTTRAILTDADAGAVVHAFGASVVAGSLIVGVVVFAVITVVQLVVVARGAERVAEVAARFALDALPGKQMAIDAELRGGTLDPTTATERRRDLERESQLYGAMDGAMRFVKGDAIAAIVIVVINLIGGVAIGVGVQGMSAREAAETYSLLSIGAGLVAQIPSLLVAVASGLLVTRVASAGDRALGEDLGAHLGQEPRVFGATAILLIVLAFVPGLPLVPFVVLGLVAALGAVGAARSAPAAAPPLDEPGARDARIVIAIAPPLHATLAATSLHPALAEVRADVASSTGIHLPAAAVRSDRALADGEVAILVDGTRVAYARARDLTELRSTLPELLASIAPELLGVDHVAELVEQTGRTAPVLVREVVGKLVSLPTLAEIVRGLARERIPIEPLAPILEALAVLPLAPGTAATGSSGRDVPALIEQLRPQLRRQISARWAPRGQLEVYTVDAMIEDAVRTALDRRQGATVLALEPEIANDIVTAVRDRLGSGPAVILTSGDVRRHLRGLLESELPEIAVLAAHDLVPGTAIRTAGRITVA